jgi:hypothetical protein
VIPLSGAPPLLSPALAGADGVVVAVVVLALVVVRVTVVAAPLDPVVVDPAWFEVELSSEPQAPRTRAAATDAIAAICFICP